MGMLVVFVVQCQVMVGVVVSPVDPPRGPNENGTDIGWRGNATNKTAFPYICTAEARLCC